MFFNVLTENGNVYMGAELLCRQISKSEEDLLDLYFTVTYFKTVPSCIHFNCAIIKGVLGG